MSKTPPDPRIPGSYFIRTFGCQMNEHDSEHVAGVLERAGYARAGGPETAGLILFNTCSVRDGAEERVWGNLSTFSFKQAGLPSVAVFGCMAQRFGVEILRRCPGVDLVFGLDSIERLPVLLDRCRAGRICDTGDISVARYEHLSSRRGSVSRAWVPVSHGCDNFCSYCVVPFVRGRLRSRPHGEVKAEVEALAASGVVEVTLLGQNVNSYGRDLGGASDFARLLELVASVPGIRRVKFETSHPRDLTDDIIAVMASTPEVCEYLHLPVQSGSDRVLSLMNRGYTTRYYAEMVERARASIPGLAVSTDIMVGFPGETDRDFERTLDLVERVRFDNAYIFIYSRREETAAARMQGEVPPDVKSGRFKELRRLQDSITCESLRDLAGRCLEVLIEGEARRGDYMVGRARGHQVVLLPGGEAPVDSLVEAVIEEAGKHAVRGSALRVIGAPGRD